MNDEMNERARRLLSEALAEVRDEWRAAGRPLHGWRHEAALRAIGKALGSTVRLAPGVTLSRKRDRSNQESTDIAIAGGVPRPTHARCAR